MKIFWALIVAAFVTTGLLFVSGEDSASGSSTTVVRAISPIEADEPVDASMEAAAVTPEVSGPSPEPEAEEIDIDSLTEASAEVLRRMVEPKALTETPAMTEDGVDESAMPQVASIDTESTNVSEPVVVEPVRRASEEAAPVSTSPAATDAEVVAVAESAAEEAPAVEATATETIEAPVMEASAPASSVAAANVELVGEGTKDSPYVLSWDALLSAKATFDPKNGKEELPPLVEAIDGKWIRLSGYTLFPMANPQPRELLLMLNAWDGCCIGVPPSPYDAVEVTLAQSVGEERFAETGAVVGKLKVDPYLVGDWLIGLYVISEASFSAEG